MNVLTAAALVAADKPALTEDTVRPGLLGLFFFVALFVATYFLWRSMNKQLKKVDAHFEAEEPEAVRDRDDVSAQEQIAIDQAALGRVGREQPRQSGAVPPAGPEGADGTS